MKILFVIRSIYQFSYVESIVKSLDNRGHAITLLFDKKWSENYSLQIAENFLSNLNNTQMGWSLQRTDSWRKLIFWMRELRSYVSYLRRPDQSKYYRMRWKRYLPKPLRKVAGSLPVRYLLSRDTVFGWLTRFEKHVPPDPKILESLRHKKPDVVVVTPMIQRFSEEVEYAKAAIEAGIPTVVPSLSWDVLTTKGLFHIIPDLLLAWNDVQRTEANEIHGIENDHILITGSPFFDKWFEIDELKEGRSSFCRRVGLNPAKPYLLYLGSSKNIAEDETWLVHEIINKIKCHPDSKFRELSFLVRPHPTNTKHYARLENSGAIVWPKEGALPQEKNSQRDFYNSVIHSTLAAGINTSGMIDAIIIGKPCLTIMPSRYRRTQLQAAHFKYLLDADVLEVTKNSDAAIKTIGKILDGKDMRLVQRQQFIHRFARPLGMHRTVGNIAAQVIEMMAKREEVGKIKAEMGADGFSQLNNAEKITAV